MRILRAVAPLAISFAVTCAAVAQTANSASQKPPAVPAVATSWKQLPVPPLKPFHPQQPRRVELPNGMVLFLQEDHELPFINGTIRIRGGSRDQPAEKAGFAARYAETWGNGGTKTT